MKNLKPAEPNSASAAISLGRRSLVLGALACIGGHAVAQTAPFSAKPITLLVGVAAGGAVDTIARLYAAYLSQTLSTPVIVENRPGAFQIPAIRALMSSKADGHTLFLTNASAVALAPATRHDLPYDPRKDFTYVAQVGIWSAIIVVKKDLPVRNLRELVAYSQANPTKLNYASAGTGTGSHLKVEYLKSVTGLKAAHIPYKSDADVIRELMGGNVDFGLVTTLGAMPMISSGKVKAIAVTAKQPLSFLPDVAGTEQSGFRNLDVLEPYSFVGFIAPAGTPEPIVKKLNDAINKVTEIPEIKARMRDSMYTEPVSGTPQAFREFAAQEFEKARDLAKLFKPD